MCYIEGEILRVGNLVFLEFAHDVEDASLGFDDACSF